MSDVIAYTAAMVEDVAACYRGLQEDEEGYRAGSGRLGQAYSDRGVVVEKSRQVAVGIVVSLSLGRERQVPGAFPGSGLRQCWCGGGPTPASASTRTGKEDEEEEGKSGRDTRRQARARRLNVQAFNRLRRETSMVGLVSEPESESAARRAYHQ